MLDRGLGTEVSEFKGILHLRLEYVRVQRCD